MAQPGAYAHARRTSTPSKLPYNTTRRSEGLLVMRLSSAPLTLTSATRFTRALGDSRAARSTVPRVIVFAPVKQTVLKKQQQYRDRSKIIVGFGSTLDFVLTHSASCTGIRARSKLLLGRVRPPRPVPVHNNEIPSRLLDQHWMSTRFYGMPVAYR